MKAAPVAIIDCPSPNHDARPDGVSVDILLLHYTGMQSAGAALERLTDPAAKVSAHYLVDGEGQCFRLVPEGRRAWHAGHASWQGARDINARSVGIELANPGHAFGYRPFPAAQMQSLVLLARGILARHPIPPGRVLAHSDVAPDRKEDPGEGFDWALLAAEGIGLWPAPGPLREGEAGGEDDFRLAMQRLAAIGYAAPDIPAMGAGARDVLLAFQRRWMAGPLTGSLSHPSSGTLTNTLTNTLTGALTPETAARIREIYAAMTEKAH